jgi:hypothetical protein
MDVQITPEPTPEEREAIVRALELEVGAPASVWARAAREPDEEDYATAPPRHSRGATRA